MSNNIEEDIEYLEQFIGIKKEYKYKPIKIKTMINTRQAIENILNAYKKNQNIVDEIRGKINERQFELQQEYKEFKDDIRLNTLQEIYYMFVEED